MIFFLYKEITNLKTKKKAPKKNDKYNVGEMNFKVLFYKDLLDENRLNYMETLD